MPARLHSYSFRDYLVVEEMSGVKHEYLDGEIYAMAGGSARHAALSMRVGTALASQLRKGCETFSSDLRIRVLPTGLATYPDVTVVCGPLEPDPESKDTVVNPTVLVEVLSASTIAYDLGQKFEHYRLVPSLQAVVYVWQDQPRLEIRERVGDVWRTTVTETRGTVLVAAVDCRLDLATVYDGAPSA
ncbi:MAG TPA: Uma2 family endonuclease [Polyangia bacterium]|nr:Uma2 family endonuclease [Polyangia bacterium]